MTVIKRPLLSPIRFYPELTFGSAVTFQNPDNRVSTGYNWEGVRSFQYYLPIPKEWPDGQAGIDVLINTDAVGSTFYAKLYDEDDADYKDLNVVSWLSIDSGHQWRVWVDCLTVADGVYTIKLFDTDDDALLVQSEALLIGEWFDDVIPFEYWNFENDFGAVFDTTVIRWTGRVFMPIKLYDPEPTFEKEQYMDDPGTLTTLRVTPQRVYNFDSEVAPVHISELFQLACSCSILYLDRININTEDIPASEPVEGSNLKTIQGQAVFVDFNTDYVAEDVETVRTNQSKIWNSDTYTGGGFVGDTFTVNDPLITAPSLVESEDVTYVDGDIILVKIVLTQQGDPTLPFASLALSVDKYRIKEFGENWISYRMSGAGTFNFYLRNDIGDAARFEAVLTIYKVE